VLQASDPFTCIDLDVKDNHSVTNTGARWPKHKHTPQRDLQFYSSVVTLSGSYCELSASGKGVHVWVKGKLPGDSGRRSGQLEIYDDARFIVCTGNAVGGLTYNKVCGYVQAVPERVNRPVAENQKIIDLVLQEIILSGKTPDKQVELVEIEATERDSLVWERAAGAANGEKFIALCEGKWEGNEFPSQSEEQRAVQADV